MGRPKGKYKNGQQALIDSIYKRFGGASAVAKKCNISIFTILTWKFRGKVPLIAAGYITRKLGLQSTLAFNFQDVQQYEGNLGIPWEQVVMVNCNPGDANKILKLKYPTLELLPYVD